MGDPGEGGEDVEGLRRRRSDDLDTDRAARAVSSKLDDPLSSRKSFTTVYFSVSLDQEEAWVDGIVYRGFRPLAAANRVSRFSSGGGGVVQTLVGPGRAALFVSDRRSDDEGSYDCLRRAIERYEVALPAGVGLLEADPDPLAEESLSEAPDLHFACRF